MVRLDGFVCYLVQCVWSSVGGELLTNTMLVQMMAQDTRVVLLQTAIRDEVGAASKKIIMKCLFSSFNALLYMGKSRCTTNYCSLPRRDSACPLYSDVAKYEC